MSLINLYNNNKNSVLDGHFILIDYDLFFNEENLGNYTRFAIDDSFEIEQLKDILKLIRLNDSNAAVYVCAYGNELQDNHGEKFLYADSIWINGSISKELLNHEFHNNLHIEPSRIELLDVIEEKDQLPILYFSMSGKVIDLSASSNSKYLENVITLYWD